MLPLEEAKYSMTKEQVHATYPFLAKLTTKEVGELLMHIMMMFLTKGEDRPLIEALISLARGE